METSKQYDAQVLGVLDGRIDVQGRSLQGLQFSYIPEDGATPEVLPGELVNRLIFVREAIESIEIFKSRGELTEDLQDQLSRWIAICEKDIDQTKSQSQSAIVDALRQGNPMIHLLFNSPSIKYGREEELIKSWLKEISLREGSSVATYAPNSISHGITDLWAYGNHRYALITNTIVFNAYATSPLQENYSREMERRAEFFEKLKEPGRSKLPKKIMPERHQGLEFSGLAAESVGLADQAFEHPAAMREHFNQSTNGVWAEDPRVISFWRNADREFTAHFVQEGLSE